MRFYAEEGKTKITGRTLFLENTRYLGYSGSSVSFTFVGKKALARIWSNPNDWDEASASFRAYLAVYVNQETEPIKRICLDQEEADYVLYEADETKEITITLVKYSEAAFGKCGIRYLEIDTDKLLTPPAKKKHTLEIIGDSITCGYGVEAENEACAFCTATENPTLSYSLLTARALEVDVNLVSWSGNGIISGYVEEDATEPLEKWLMPEVYRYTDISTSEKLFGEPEEKWEKWDFSRFTPDMVMIYLGTNDCSWCKDIQERRDHYREQYKVFLKFVREHNPKAEILCMLGTMDLRVIKELEEAVSQFATEHDDQKLHFLPLPAQDPADGYGADWHPSPLTHRKTAELVIKTAKEIMNW